MPDQTTTPPTTEPAQPESLADEAKSQKEFEELQKQEASLQNLPEGGVPEQRPIASQRQDDEALHSGVFKKLREAGDDRAGAPAMPKSAYDKASSDAQKKKASKDERQAVLHPGARGWVDNEGEPDHGRAIAIVGVREYESLDEEKLASMGTPESRFAQVKAYQCESRDGRSEMLVVSAEHIRVDTSSGADWGKTGLNLP